MPVDGARARNKLLIQREIPLYLMLLVPVTLLLVYSYGPMFGLVMAFQKFDPASGFLRSPWVGLANYVRVFSLPDVRQVVWNTFFIATMKIIVETVAAILAAILLNEIRTGWYKRTVQTIIYFPYFLSWVILAGIFRDLLARDGMVNVLLQQAGARPVLFLGQATLFPYVLVATETWQVNGFGTIIFLASIASINPDLYEAAAIDGAGRTRQTLAITLPGMSTTIILMIVLSMGWILNAGFDQILMLYNPLVYSTGDVLDTWVFRMGLQQAQYSAAAAVGLMRSVVSLILIVASYSLASKTANYHIF